MASNPSTGFDFNRPTIIALLYLASFVVGVTGIVGIVLAYVWRSEAGTGWEASHYTYLIRTFWIGLAGSIVGVLLTVVLIGFPLLLAIAIWVVVRSVVALLKAQKQEPIPDPLTFMV
jgi:uncharacterized membrane protein